MAVFYFRGLFDDFRRFRVFVFCYRAHSKTRKPRKILISSFFEVLRLFILFLALFQEFCAFRVQLSKCCSRLSISIYYYCLKVAFVVIKAKTVLKYQIGSFSAISSNGSYYQWVFSNLESFLLIFGISLFFPWVFPFSHRAYSNTQKSRKVFISSFLEVLRLFI